MRALLVEDNEALSSQAKKALKLSGFEVDTALNIQDADEAFVSADYDLVLLDRMLPDGDGIEWLRSVRGEKIKTPVIIMTATLREVDQKIDGLNSGADDYIVKPIEFEELVARVRAVLRRTENMISNTLQLGALSFDITTREVSFGGELLSLPRRELCLLECLIKRANHVVPKTTLEEKLYGYDGEVTPNAIEVSVHRLRSTLKKCGSSARIHTARGVGYMIYDENDLQGRSRPCASQMRR
ncbi:MAG: response regulator transcription factor [Pseudomonadota bacterium]